MKLDYDKYLSDLSGSSVADESRYETFTLDAADLAHLVEGTNVLAAEVHQDRPTSSDIYWDMEFITSVNKGTRTKNQMKKQLFLKKYMIIKNYFTGKLMIHDPSVSVTLDAKSKIKNGVVFTGEYAEFHGEGFANTTVRSSRKKTLLQSSTLKVRKLKKLLLKEAMSKFEATRMYK